MQRAGSHWWDHDAMQSFGSRPVGPVYNGANGVFFVTSELSGINRADRQYAVHKYLPESKEIQTVAQCETKQAAIRTATEMAGDLLAAAREPFVTATALRDLRLALARCNIAVKQNAAAKLIGLAAFYRLAAAAAHKTGDLTIVVKIERELKEWALANTGGKVEIVTQRDPNLATVILRLPSGETNDWMGRGYRVPQE